MDRQDKKWIAVKIVIYLGFFSLLHFLYEWFPNFLIGIFAGTSESVLQHMKLAFWAYFFTVLVEYAIFKKKDNLGKEFWTMRIFTTMLIPWLEIIVWYIAPIFFDHIEPLGVELAYSFVVVIIIGLAAITIENNVEAKFNKKSFWLILGLFLLTIVILTVFSFKEPFIDVFHVPDGHDH